VTITFPPISAIHSYLHANLPRLLKIAILFKVVEPRLKQCIPITEVHCEIVRVS
jgi:hypothetical protein